MKKSTKLKSLELFSEFTEKNNYGIYNDSFMSTSYTIREPKAGEKRSVYYFEDFLGASLDKVRNTKKFFDFIKYALDKGELEVAVHQAIKKTPSAKSYDYNGSVRDILKSLQPYKEAFFQYVARPKFLENSSDVMSYILSNIYDQEHRIAVFEAMFQTKEFNNINTQKTIYRLFNENIRDKSKLEKYFNKIEKIKEEDSIVSSTEITSVVMIGISTVKLANANLLSSLSGKDIAQTIKKIVEEVMPKEKELGISKVIWSANNTEYFVINIFCPPEKAEFNRMLTEEMINTVARIDGDTPTDIGNKVFKFKEDFGSFIQQVKSTHLAHSLSDSLDGSKNNKQAKLKI